VSKNNNFQDEKMMKGEHEIVWVDGDGLEPLAPRLLPVFDLSESGAKTLDMYLSPLWAEYQRDKAPYIYKSGTKTFIASGPIISIRTKIKSRLFHGNVYQYKPTTILEDVSKLDVAAIDERLADHAAGALSKFKA